MHKSFTLWLGNLIESVMGFFPLTPGVTLFAAYTKKQTDQMTMTFLFVFVFLSF